MRSMESFHVVTHADTGFLQFFLWERFKTLGPKPAQYNTVDMVEVKENDEVKVKPDRPYKTIA